MDQRLTSRSNLNRWVLADCPNTGEEVVGSSWREKISVLNTDALWWYCPACGGWHVRQSDCCNDASCDQDRKH